MFSRRDARFVRALALVAMVVLSFSANAKLILEEQFDYEIQNPDDVDTQTPLDGLNGGMGFDGAWTATQSHGRLLRVGLLIFANGDPLTFNDDRGLHFTDVTGEELPVAGAAVSRYGAAGRTQAERLLSAESQAALTKDNTTIWFSALAGGSSNHTNSFFLFGTDALIHTDIGQIAAPGQGFGFNIGATVNALAFNNSIDNTLVDGTYSQTLQDGSNHYDTSLLVGKINWKPNGTADEFFLFNVTDMSKTPDEADAIASITNLDFDQSAFDTVTYADGAWSVIDEIRFGTSFANIVGILNSAIASSSLPANGESDVLRGSALSWSPGEFAATHNVYLGESFEDVNAATVPTAEGLDVNSFDPGRLDFGKTYYWRVDEVNGTPDNSVYKGEVWAFEVEPYSIPIPGDSIIVTASSESNQFSTAEKVIDGSGLDPNAPDTHDMEAGNMWFTAAVDLDPWMQFEFDGIKKLDAMKVWNANSAAELAIGWGVKDVIAEVSLDGVTWTAVADANQFSRAPGTPGYDQPDLIDLGGAVGKYLRLDIESNWGGLIMSYGLSEIQLFEIPVQPRTPDPADGSVHVDPDAVVTWRPGREADQHILYVGTDMTAVQAGTAPSVSTNTNSLSLDDMGAELGQTYYWRVDEINEAKVPSTWAGPLWSLSTAGVLVLDDFDGYNNVSPDRPFQTWLDGIGYSADEFFPVAYGGNGTGSAIGHDIWSLSSPYYNGEIMETLIAMPDSDLSMPFYYNNSGTTASETTANIADLKAGQDWSQNGIQFLTLHFRADSLSEALDTTSAFTAGDTIGWFSQGEISQDGSDAAQSKRIGNNENAVMQTTVTGAGTVSFAWKVSSEADWDFLEFYIDGALQDQISGEVDWQLMTYQIAGTGSHTLEWRYTKDGAVLGGEDTGWVDTLTWDGGGQPGTAPGNTGQLYAKVNGVKVEYPGSVTSVEWVSWKIDLTALGTNLQNVTSLTIGIDGAGASGLLYLDNFQLEPGE